MTRFINDDFKIKVGGRKAPKITINEFKEIINRIAEKHEDEIDYDPDDAESNALQLISTDSTLLKDRKYQFDDENIDMFGDTFTGFHTLTNGLTYFGFSAGGDCDPATYGIVYYDGKKLRLFQPTYGNTINLKYKAAFGCEGYYEDPDEDYPSREYVAKYGFDDEYDTSMINFDAMLEEITARIEIEKTTSNKTSTKKTESDVKNTYYFNYSKLDPNDFPPPYFPNAYLVVVKKSFFDKNGYIDDKHNPNLYPAMNQFSWNGGESSESVFDVFGDFDKDDFIKRMADKGFTMIENINVPTF